MKPETLLKLLETRRSIRQFKQDFIDPKIIEKRVNAARLAPSARNLQPIEFVYIDSQDLVKQIFPITRWAGYINPDGNPIPGQEPVAYLTVIANKSLYDGNYKYDIGAMVENFILSAWSYGIGSCWILSVTKNKLREILNIPDKYEIDCVIALGYPAEEPMFEDSTGNIKYYKDENGRLHVPKRTLSDIFHINKLNNEEKMHPDIVKIGPITIHSFGLMMAIAFLIAYYILQWEVKRRGDNEKLASDLIFWGAIGGIIGAKLFSVFENFGDFLADPLHTLFSGSGFVFHGGLMGGTLSVIIILYLNKKHIGTYADIAGPLVLIGQGIGRIGCFLAGCCHGSVTSCGCGVSYPAGSQASYFQYHHHLLDSPIMKSLPVHASPLYETVLNILMAFLLIKFIRPNLKKRGSTFGISIIYAGCVRFLLEFVRINPKGLWGLTHYQFSSIFFVLLGIVVLVFLAKTEKEDFEIGK